MKHSIDKNHPPEQADCARTRLAKGSLAAVDACECGMLQLHIGALTLRLAPCALAELASTLNRALVAHGLAFPEDSQEKQVFSMGRPERGEA